MKHPCQRSILAGIPVFLATLAAGLSLGTGPVHSQDQGSLLLAPGDIGSGAVTIDILDRKIVHDDRYIVGVRMALEDGWRSYWRLADGSGLPTRFHIHSTRNVASTRIHWPAPSLIEQFGSVSVGYTGEIVFPIEITPRDSADDRIQLQSSLEFGICRDVCIPIRREIAVDMSTLDTAETFGPIAHALESRPLDHLMTAPGRTLSCLPIRIAGQQFQTVVPLPVWQQVDRVGVIFEDTRGVAHFAPPAITLLDDHRVHLATHIQFLTGERRRLRPEELQILLLLDARAYEIRGCRE